MKKNELKYDVLIIGCGVAGLASACKLAETGLAIGIITREEDPQISNTFYAQGGIIYSEDTDHELAHDILRASAYTSNKKATEFLVQHSGKILKELLLDKAKSQFETDEKGNLLFTLEAAHSKPRILYRGDFTGREVQVSLLNYLKDKEKFPNVEILTKCTAIDLLTPLHHGVKIEQRYEDNKVLGAYVFDQKNDEVLKILSKKTVLATGGIGALYLHHSNSDGARGDGHAMARRAGAILTDMEFIQFHPTTFFDRGSHRRFLISEALRGEGGKLVNFNGKQFMKDYHKDLELAPRDIVARAIAQEIILTKHECVYLDISHKPEAWLKERFPTIYEHCLKSGVDITKVPIPVVPAAHYTCGGIKTDLKGRTNLQGLYAVGEVACTGLHGANRLASTSLLEGLTFGYAAACDILNHIQDEKIYDASKISDWKQGHLVASEALINQDWMTLKQTMWNYVGLTRSSHQLNRAYAMFNELNDEIQLFYKNAMLKDGLIGLRNAVEVADLVLSASRRNKESIGCFYRV